MFNSALTSPTANAVTNVLTTGVTGHIATTLEGIGDGASLGLTGQLRQALGVDCYVEKNGYYVGGAIFGAAATTYISGASSAAADAAATRIGSAGKFLDYTTETASDATKAVSEAVQALKGPVADAIPRSLPQQMALDTARQGYGVRIMGTMNDTPRLVANYGQGEWVKMQYVLRGNDSSVTVHYFRNVDTGVGVEFKFP